MKSIKDIVAAPEGQTFDCKSVNIEPKSLAITIIAMANADGGTIAIGVSDKNRRIEGVDKDEAHLNELLRAPSDFCVPTVMVTTEFIPCKDFQGDENRILLMHVPASPQLHANQADDVFWRVGDKSKKLSFDERMRLMYDKGERYFEDSAAFGATIEDIDMKAVGAYTKRIKYGKSPLTYLKENKGFLSEDKEGLKVSTACILLFGKRPQDFFPRARVRFIKYSGTEEKVGAEMNVIKDVTFEGRILEQIQKTIEYLETQVQEHSYLGKEGIFVTERNYPRFVIQEMTVNSVCHRDYSIKGTEIQIKMFDDRIVFETPGRLPGIVRIDNMRHTHFSRNPKIAEYLKAYDYVKEFGEGIDRICRELSEQGTQEPQYNLVAFIMKATVYASTAKEEPAVNEHPENSETNGANFTIRDKNFTILCTTNGANCTIDFTIDNRIFTIVVPASTKDIVLELAENHNTTTKEIAQAIGQTERAVKYKIASLKKQGIVTRIGTNRSGHWEIIGLK